MSTFLLTGCSVDDIQSSGWITGDNGLKQDLSMNWFGKDDDESRDGNSAYSNREGFIFHNYDINDVEESKLDSLPAYDFSGPDPTINGDASSTKDSSLLQNLQKHLKQRVLLLLMVRKCTLHHFIVV